MQHAACSQLVNIYQKGIQRNKNKPKATEIFYDTYTVHHRSSHQGLPQKSFHKTRIQQQQKTPTTLNAFCYIITSFDAFTRLGK